MKAQHYETLLGAMAELLEKRNAENEWLSWQVKILEDKLKSAEECLQEGEQCSQNDNLPY